MANLTNSPKNWTEASEALRGKEDRKIGHNTYLIRDWDGAIVAQLHGNGIVRYTEDGVEVNWCGYVGNTTADRINQLAPGRFNRKLGVPQHNGVPMASRGWVKVS